VTEGGRFGGCGFYLLKGKPLFLWNLVNCRVASTYWGTSHDSLVVRSGEAIGAYIATDHVHKDQAGSV
jgi:hypothetical protein